MLKNELIYAELKELNSFLANISNKNLFSVPRGYFETLTEVVLYSVQDENVMEALNIPSLHGKVPDGYFESLSHTIMSKIKMEEAGSDLEKDSPVLPDYIRHINVFKVGEGYFENLIENILAKVSVPARVIPISRRPSIFKYAIAACISGIIGLSLFSYFDEKNGIEKSTPVFKEIAQADILKSAGEIIKNNSFDKMMDNLSDDEIEGYLKNDGEDVHSALVASLTDEKSLPNEDDYFTDDKALDNFLSDQNIVQSGKN